MKEYFILQFKIINRKLVGFGVNPVVGFAILLIGFIGLSFYLFLKTEFAEYIFVLVALGFVLKLSERNRNDFLKHCFKKNDYLKIRAIENSIVIFPFIVFLISNQLILAALTLTLVALIMAFVKINSTFNNTIPTIFYKKPFEFTVGFRNTFYLFFLSYLLAVIAVSVGNFNLGGFALLLSFIISLSFYSKPENEYYVWVFKSKSQGFLFGKIKTAVIYSTILSMPTFITLEIFFFSETSTLLILQLLGYIYLVTIILAKYSAYPNEINLLQGILIGVSLLFPPILVAVIPFFYLQSVKQLNTLLE